MSAESQDRGYQTTPRSLMDPSWLAERLAAEVAELSRPLWAEDAA